MIFDFSIVAAAQTHGVAWLKLLPAGVFQLRDGRGPFDAGDRSSLEAIVARTAARLGRTQLMIDYDHQAIFSAKEGVGGRAEAAGWVTKLEARDDGIWGEVNWTDAAAAKIRDQVYRYLSPLFTWDKSSGRVGILINAALVNMPALDLRAVAASQSIAAAFSQRGTLPPAAGAQLDPVEIAQKAGAYQQMQALAGNNIHFSDAVAHVMETARGEHSQGPASTEIEAQILARRAVFYQYEQGKAGNHVSISDAVSYAQAHPELEG